MSERSTVHLQRCLDRLQAGDETARTQLLEAACKRLTHLARKMLKADGRLKRWIDTDDVFQNAALRLYRALQEVRPASLREFFRLAAVQIRRELIDLGRHYYGPAGAAAKHESQVIDQGDGRASRSPCDPSDTSHEPSRLAAWSEFHEQIGALPEDEREAFELIWYQGLTHAQAAKLLNVATKTIQRRWQAACLRLHERLGGQLPGL